MNKELVKAIARPALLLGLFALVGVLILAIVNQQTLERIAKNEREALMEMLLEVVDSDSHDNDLLNDSITLSAELSAEMLNSSAPVTVYRAKKQERPSAAIFVTTTDKGYKGSIKIVVGVRMDHTISGVRVVQHNETPGLGDKMETEKSPWVFSFNNTSLQKPGLAEWAVKKDGGIFDQFTGATITPRAIVGAVRDVLIWSNQDGNLMSIFTPLVDATSPSEKDKGI